MPVDHDALPWVSIVIPCWNAERFIADAIESALAQTYSKVEIIVIDDGSTDKSLDIIRSFGPRIRWESGPNRGGGAARNRGVEIARGEFIQFLDADDVLHPDKLQRMVPVAVRTGPSVLVSCDWRLEFYDRLRAPMDQELSYDGSDAFAWCLANSLQTASPVHWKKVLLKANGFDPRLPCCQEFDLHLRLAVQGIKLLCVPEVLCTHRRQPASVSSDCVRVLDERIRVLRRIADHLNAHGELTETRRIALASAHALDGRELARRGAKGRARDAFAAAAALAKNGAHLGFRHPATFVVSRLFGPLAAEVLVQSVVRLGLLALIARAAPRAT